MEVPVEVQVEVETLAASNEVSTSRFRFVTLFSVFFQHFSSVLWWTPTYISFRKVSLEFSLVCAVSPQFNSVREIFVQICECYL